MKLIKVRHNAFSKLKLIPSPMPLPVPSRVVLPLQSPWGQALPVVERGDEVQTGQRIAQSDNPLIPPVHATISGTVDIRPWPSQAGAEIPAIVIAGNGKEPPRKRRSAADDVTAMEPRELWQRLASAGIREADPHAWPLAVRVGHPDLLEEIIEDPPDALCYAVETLIINGLDRQPGVYVRRSALIHQEQDLLAGIALLQKVSGAQSTVLTVAKNQPLSDEFEHQLADLKVRLIRCPDKYPLALEPILAQSVTKEEVPQPDNDTRLIGTTVVDVATVLQALDAMRDQLPPIDTAMQIEVPAEGIWQMVRVRTGMLLEELLEHVPTLPQKPAKVILGGLFLGYAQHTLQAPIEQALDSIIFQNRDELTLTDNEPCFGCGNCVRYCPMRLLPNELGKYCEYGKFDDAEKKFLFHCIECGICGYVCPARRPMVQLLRFGKQQLASMTEAS